MKPFCDLHTETSDNSCAEAQLPRMVDSECVAAKGFSMDVKIDNPISVSEAARIMGYTERRVRQLCEEYQDSEGETGLKSKKFGRDWQIEQEAAQNRAKNSKPETN